MEYSWHVSGCFQSVCLEGGATKSKCWSILGACPRRLRRPAREEEFSTPFCMGCRSVAWHGVSHTRPLATFEGVPGPPKVALLETGRALGTEFRSTPSSGRRHGERCHALATPPGRPLERPPSEVDRQTLLPQGRSHVRPWQRPRAPRSTRRCSVGPRR